MTITRISTYNLHKSTLNDASNVQAELFKLQSQISSNLKARTYGELNGQVEQFTALDNKIKRTDMFVQNNRIASTRLQTMSTVTDQIIDSTNGLKNVLILRRNQTLSESLGFENQLDAAWRAISAQLNVSTEGRYLFGGTRTDTPPVDPENFPHLAIDGVPDDGYYLGSKENTSLRVQDDYQIEQTIRADDVAFQKIYAAFAIAKQGHAEDNDALLVQASDMLSEGLEGVINLQVTMNATRVNVDDASEKLDNLKLYWKGVKESIINTDLVSASTEVAINQGILQASFQVFARINSLQLSDFLR